MNKNSKLIKCVSMLLIMILVIGVLINIFLVRETQAKSQNTKDYKKGSNMLDDYPGYASLLDNLLEEHPNWTFTILYTGLDWDTVIRNETTAVHGRNLVQNKSGEWVCSVCGNKAYDNGSWRCASEAAIAYMMDPRNSLNDTDIFQFEELTSSNCNIDNIKSMTKGTYLEGHEQGIVDASIQNGVNGIYVVARLIQEQGSDGSELVSGEQGYYNAFNIGASGNTKQEIINNGKT